MRRLSIKVFLYAAFTLMLPLTLGQSCAPQPPNDLAGDHPNAPSESADAAQAAFSDAVGLLVSSSDVYSAADQMDAAGARLFDSNAEVDDVLDAGLASLIEKVSTPMEYLSLIEGSIALNGRVTDGIEVGGTGEQPLAQSAACGDGSYTVVYFINGINNSYDEFESSRIALAKLLADNPKKITVFGYYNVSAKDREYSIFGGYGCTFACKVAHALDFIRFGTTLQDFCNGVCSGAGVLIDLAQASEQALSEWGSLYPEPTDSFKFRNVIKSCVDQGWTVIIIAHSQGNFMAQQALDGLTEQEGDYGAPADAVGVISVGSPTSRKFACFDSNQASVMIRNEAMKLLPGTAEPTCEDATGSVGNGPAARVARHSFNESYLRNPCAKEMIRKGVQWLSCHLENPRGKPKQNSDGGAVCAYTSDGVTVTSYTNSDGTRVSKSGSQMPNPGLAEVFICRDGSKFKIATSLSNVTQLSVTETVPSIDPYMPGMPHSVFYVNAPEGGFITMPVTLGEVPSGTTGGGSGTISYSTGVSISIEAQDEGGTTHRASLGFNLY